MRALPKSSRLFSRISAAAKRALHSKMLPDPARVLALPPNIAACNVCGFIAKEGNPRLCPRCGKNQRQRSFKQLFLERLQVEIFGQGALEDGLLLSPGEVERAVLSSQLRRPVISSLYQTYHGTGPFVRSDVRDLVPFRNESFDYVQACNVLDYVPELGQALRAVHRVVRSSGAFVFLLPEHNLLPANEPISVSVHSSVTGNYWPDRTAVPLVRLGRRTLSDLLQQTGFQPVEVQLVEPLSRLRCTWWLCRRG